MPRLIVITGPTGVGKTEAAIQLAERLHCYIINADSRQVYRGIPIATAAPTAEQMARVRHHFVGTKHLDEAYNAWQFEQDVLALLPTLWPQSDTQVMCGGSMMYVDAVCNGIDDMPDILPHVRSAIKQQLDEQGLEALVEELEQLDPEYAAAVDRKNPVRVCHALEVCRQTGRPYSTWRSGERKMRPFDIVKVGLNMERDELFSRINRRVDAMVAAGLEQEARQVLPMRHLQSLNTVGLKEMFACFDGTLDRATAIERIKKNTRVYAKKQLTWLRRDPDITWLQPHELQAWLQSHHEQPSI